MIVIAPRKNCGDRERHHGVAGRKARALPENRAVTVKKSVVVRAVHGTFGGALSPRDRFRDHHQDGVIYHRFAGKERRALVVRVLAKQADGIKCGRYHRDSRAGRAGAQDAIKIVERIGFAEVGGKGFVFWQCQQFNRKGASR